MYSTYLTIYGSEEGSEDKSILNATKKKKESHIIELPVKEENAEL